MNLSALAARTTWSSSNALVPEDLLAAKNQFINRSDMKGVHE